MSVEQIFQNANFTSIIWQIATPLIFMLADIITGYIQAVINHDVQSKIMRQGLLHKVLLILIIILSFVINFAFGMNTISIGVCLYICVMEVTSILENLKKAGLDLKFTSFIK